MIWYRERQKQRERERASRLFSQVAQKLAFIQSRWERPRRHASIHPPGFLPSGNSSAGKRENMEITSLFLTPQELRSCNWTCEYRLLHLNSEQMELSFLRLQLEHMHLSSIDTHPANMLQPWLAFCRCSPDSKITIIWFIWIKEGRAFDVGLLLYSVTLRYRYLRGNMVQRWKIDILWYTTETVSRPTDWVMTVSRVGSFKLLLLQFLCSLEVISDVRLEEILKCEPKTAWEIVWYTCSKGEMGAYHSLSSGPKMPKGRACFRLSESPSLSKGLCLTNVGYPSLYCFSSWEI